ncbi:nucleotide exchange factor GrpE [Curtobacterium flaccumfaciens]|uniref:Protein GrpE n=1 Tax=Curtobacterium poinsettiae TaxID=159612 RepID=A0A9Q9P9S4_9MICO|nr:MULTISPECIES: nucleotide exchange factor GrpE [Curtobacterium]MCS6563571.1 nucleotide exchange factor GrpE [Curtobacterium flaccumfaciens pv. poinsettiae]MDT0234146.1 nucleotide exchange factor GrpE [Curtobacterium sp. BRB10]UXN23742.1 nucleotide exchange factor GrpE [Curtobacterium flaccumfaciens]UXN29640.1 nucleotide exchange factor GrpE [Curtobacterium flaccumfaciens]UYC81855.1 nucleotide exchange factor GrpE [Curtobacterium flaccumfaciens pv. poinsettiae]
MTDPKDNVPEESEPQVEGDATNAQEPEDLIEAEGPDVEVPTDGPAAGGPAADAANDLSPEDEALLADAARGIAEDKLSTEDRDLVAEMRADMLRAQAELVNFRKRVERDREANREVAIAEVVRALLPALDDLTRAEAHGDLAEGPMQVIGQKIRGGFEKFKLVQIGEKGEAFDPNIHEAIVQLPTPGATGQTVADVVEPGYKLGERVLRAAKVAVAVPA